MPVRLCRIIKEEHLEPGDFKGAYGIGYFFSRLLRGDYKYPSTTIINSVDSPDDWFTKGSGARDPILRAYDKGLNELLKKTVNQYIRGHRPYKTADLVRGFLYTLGILTDISARMQEYTRIAGHLPPVRCCQVFIRDHR